MEHLADRDGLQEQQDVMLQQIFTLKKYYQFTVEISLLLLLLSSIVKSIVSFKIVHSHSMIRLIQNIFSMNANGAVKPKSEPEKQTPNFKRRVSSLFGK